MKPFPKAEPILATIASVATQVIEWMTAGGAVLGFLVSLLTFFWWVRIWAKALKSGKESLPEKPDFGP